MRNDHVFYGHVGGHYPTPEVLEDAMRRARRLRAEAAHEIFTDLARRLGALFCRRRATKLQPR